MLRSKTFMVLGWDGPTAAPQGCKLQEEGGSGRIWSPPKLPNFLQEQRGSPGAAEGVAGAGSCRGSGAFLSSWCKHCRLLQGRGGPWGVAGLLQGQGVPLECCRAVARPRQPSGMPQWGCCEPRGAPEERPVPWESCWQLEMSLCQVTISARNDVPRGGSGSGRLPARPPPPPPPLLRPPPPGPAGSASSVPSGTCQSPTCPASGTSQVSPRDGGDRAGWS